MDSLNLPFNPDDFPILHYDPETEALLNPAHVCLDCMLPTHVVMCFFREVVAKVAKKHQAKLLFTNKNEGSDHPFYEMNYQGKRIAFIALGVGAPLSAILMEQAIQMGGRHFMAVGGCGVLDKDIGVGKLLIPQRAIRGEGVSYHYLPAKPEIAMNYRAQLAIEKTLNAYQMPYALTKTWTTDAYFRETPMKIAHYHQQGATVVEMEAAAFMAVAEFRGVEFGQILYAGDLVHTDGWDKRAWHSHGDVREQLFWLAAEACLAL